MGGGLAAEFVFLNQQITLFLTNSAKEKRRHVKMIAELLI